MLRISKHFLSVATEQLALLYAPQMRVNAIAPGAMLAARGREAEFRKVRSRVPLRRTGDIESLMQALEYLVKNTYVTGQVLYIDGGWHVI